MVIDLDSRSKTKEIDHHLVSSKVFYENLQREFEMAYGETRTGV
jgi:hypothetical protein